jgi:hypothetical protein
MTDEQLDKRFTQIAQAFEFLLHDREEADKTHTAEMAEIRKAQADLARAQAEFAENDRRLQARIEAIAEVTNKNSEEITRITREWQAYLRTRPPQ